jgi:hypothetical protein
VENLSVVWRPKVDVLLPVPVKQAKIDSYLKEEPYLYWRSSGKTIPQYSQYVRKAGAMDVTRIQSKIDEIIGNRRKFLPQVENSIIIIKERITSLQGLLRLIVELSPKEKDDEIKQEINSASSSLSTLIHSLNKQVTALEILTTRFARSTVNIGVSGEARVGKSTTLQKLTGLSDTQIPTGDGLPVTAVRSEIYNSSDEYAEITFRDQLSFIGEYINPHLNIVNTVAKSKLVITSVTELRNANIPESLGNNIDSVTSDSLRKLREARRGIDTYSGFLTGSSKKVKLSELRKFVAYPTNDEIKAEESGEKTAERAYIAVKGIRIFCKFPSLAAVKIGLVDLPGLGEIGDSVADIHLHGLEDGVDQIFLIMRPTESEGFIKSGIAKNLDQLRAIQPGIMHRGDLISAGINIYKGLDKTIATLRDDFERSINSAQESDKIELWEYQAIDENSVAELFQHLLEKISTHLPGMDTQVLNYVLEQEGSDNDILGTLEALNHTMNRILKKMPVPDKLLNQQIDEISRALIHSYNNYEAELSRTSKTESSVYEAFVSDVERVYQQTKQKIADGLFIGNMAWENKAKGQKDYYNYYRNEAQRIRREIIANYTSLDAFYTAHVESFKEKAIEIFLTNTGNLRAVFSFTDGDDSDSRIKKISNELNGTIKDEDLLDALELLKSVNFSFRNNVFLQISTHLKNLANVEDTSSGSKRKTLGDVGDIDVKIDKLRAYLTEDANSANDNIKKALLNSDDKFNEYLSICISFFIDYLYRKDAENFRHTVIRSLIREYRNYVILNKKSLAIDQDKNTLISSIKDLIQLLQAEEKSVLASSASAKQRTKSVDSINVSRGLSRGRKTR